MGVAYLDLVEIQNGERIVRYRYDAAAKAGLRSLREHPAAAGIR
ncbi:hypothetical protein [Cupriavidus sp. 8B]